MGPLKYFCGKDVKEKKIRDAFWSKLENGSLIVRAKMEIKRIY